MPQQKLYAYVDESGQDTKGALFVVGVVITAQERESLACALEAIEKESGKGIIKWHKARPARRSAYFDLISRSHDFAGVMFYDTFTNTNQYLEMTSFATAKAINKKTHGKLSAVAIYVDGLSQREVIMFSKGLRDLNIQRRKVKGVRREESNVFIRLADALCGLARDVYDGDQWAVGMLERLKKKGVVTAL